MATPGPRSPSTPKTMPIAGGRLDSWKEIARYLNREVRTVQRWEGTGGLPVYRQARGRLKGSPVYAFKSELDAWLRRNPPPLPEEEAEPGPAVSAVWKRRWVLWVAVALLSLAAAGAVVWRIELLKSPAPSLRVVRLTSFPGLARHPAFSPDGKQVAFSWNGEKADNFDIYVKFLDTGAPLRLTTHPGVDGWPAWSPDGKMIAFGRWVMGAPTVEFMTIPALGGAERKIGEFQIPPQPSSYWPGFCWTPDGKWAIAPYNAVPKAPGALALISVETLEARPLTRPAARSVGDCCPAISPDGRTLAFLRAPEGRIFDLFVVPLGPDYRPVGEPRQLTHEPPGVASPMWTGDGRELLYTATRDGARTLWRVREDASRPASPIEALGPVGHFWAISRRGDRLVYSDHPENGAIWRVDLGNGKSMTRVVSSSAHDSNPEIAPDAKRIAFVSNRVGGNRVWVSDSDGARAIDLAKTSAPFPGPARWSPDGSQIVFECQNEGNDDICTVGSGGGSPRRFTQHPARDSWPSWSRDGKWIYFTSNRSGSYQVWRAPANGTDAAAVQVTSGGGFGPVESSDGTEVFFARDRLSAPIWKVSVRGGQESQVGTFHITGRCQNFAVGAEGIYYVLSTDPERWFELWLYRFASGKPELIRRIEKRHGRGLSVSPDGRWLLFSADEAQYGDLYMVENFRRP